MEETGESAPAARSVARDLWWMWAALGVGISTVVWFATIDDRQPSAGRFRADGGPADTLGTPPAGDPATSPGGREDGLGGELFEFARAVSDVLNDRSASPPPNNSYSHETAFSRSDNAVPYISLEGTRTYSALSCTDCSGWVSFAVDAVSPLHHAVLQSQRRRPEYNRAYESGFRLREEKRTWARAFVLTNFFRSGSADRHGFRRLRDHEQFRAGDIVAYSLGRYIDPSNPHLPRPADTGHTFVVAGTTKVVDPATPDYAASGTLSDRAVEVIAVPAIDASSIPHFDPDARKNARGRFVLPRRAPGVRVKAGGIGSGTLWLALDARGRVIQRRLGPAGTFRDCAIGAIRMTKSLALDGDVLDAKGSLLVENFNNVPTRFGGKTYGRQRIDLTGPGGIRVAGGRLVLGGRSTFGGGVVVDDGWLFVTSKQGLGAGDLEVRAGHVRFEHPALDDSASLKLGSGLSNGSIYFAFTGEDVAWQLQLDGQTYGCGSWGSPTSDALFRDPRFAGPGILHLTGEASEHCNGIRRRRSGAQQAAPAEP